MESKLKVEEVFLNKTVWSLIFKPAEGINFIVSPSISNRDLFGKLEKRVKDKLRLCGASLSEIYTFINDVKVVLNYKNSEEMMGQVMNKNLPLTFKVLVEDQEFEYKVEY
jgi:hypothetical protein